MTTTQPEPQPQPWWGSDARDDSCSECHEPPGHHLVVCSRVDDPPPGDRLREEIAELVYDRDIFAGDLHWSRTAPTERERCRQIAGRIIAGPLAPLLACLTRLEALHHRIDPPDPNAGFCAGCEFSHPCPTRRALDDRRTPAPQQQATSLRSPSAHPASTETP